MSLQNRKLKVWSKQKPDQVLVVQDGSAVDSEATITVNNGFLYGSTANAAAKHVEDMQRVTFSVERMECSRDGKSLELRVQDSTNFNTYAFGPGDRVEFSADNGDAITVGGDWPTWHIGALASGQVVHFFGFVQEVRRDRSGPGVNDFVIRVVDALHEAEKISVYQSAPDDIRIPWVVFNAERGDADYSIAIKQYNSAASTVVTQFGMGNARDDTDALMTVGQILDYLQHAYQADLYARGILDGPTDTLFDATELADFTEIPPKTVFESATFAEVVKSIVRANLPDFDIRVDPRSKTWHFVAAARDVLHSGIGSVTTWTSQSTFVVNDGSLFATTGDGSSARLISATDFNKTEVVDISGVSTNTITLASPASFVFEAGDQIIPMYSTADRPPSMSIDLEAESISHDLVVDLQNVKSAVRIVSRNQKREKVDLNMRVNAEIKASLIADIEAGFDADWIPEHSHRRVDRGPESLGIEIDEIVTVAGGGGDYTRLFISENSSAYGDEHLVPTAGQGEWVGTAAHFLTSDGQARDVQGNRVSGIITFFDRSGWMDSPTNSIRRYRIDLDRDILASLPDLKDEVNDADPDLFEMTSSDAYKPNNPNRRWLVGRSYAMVSADTDDEARYLDSTCPPVARYNHYGTQVQQPMLSLEQSGSGAPRTFQEIVDFHGFNTQNPFGGTPRAWFLPQPPPPVDPMAQLCATIPSPNFGLEPIDIEFDRITLTVNEVRAPAAGFAGLAWHYHNHAEELVLVSDKFEHESQEAQFALIAQAIWRRVSNPHYTGSIELSGVTPWLRMSDLGFRVQFGAGNTGFNGGVVNEQRRFWGLVENVVYDFANQTTSIAFDNRRFFDAVQQPLFERKFVSETEELRDIRSRLEQQEHLLECIQRQPPKAPEHPISSCMVQHRDTSQTTTNTKVEVKEVIGWVGDTQLGMTNPHATGARSSHAYRSTNPPFITERDFYGRVAAFSVPGGGMYGGSESGSGFTVSTSTVPVFEGQAQANATAVQELSDVFFGADMMTPVPMVTARVATGSTTTVIELESAIANDARYNGGTVEFFNSGSEMRPPYSITSHTGSAITLSGAMSESAPTVGMTVVVRPPFLMLPDATDFPNGGRGFQDVNGNWFVASGGAITAAEVTGSVLTEDTTSPATPTFNIGASGMSMLPKGSWNFSGATVTGLPASEYAADSIGTAAIQAAAVTATKMEDIATATILGRTTAGAGAREALTPAQARAVMGVDSSEVVDFALEYRRSGTWTPGQRIQGWIDSSDTKLRLRVSAGETFQVTGCACHIQNGSTAGTYAYRMGVTEYGDDQSSSGGTPRYAVDSLEWTSTATSDHVYFKKVWDGVTPLATVTGGASISIMPFLMSEATSPDTTTSDNCLIIVTGRFV